MIEKIYRKNVKKDFTIPLKKISSDTKSKILFIVNIHGDEPVGQLILNELIKKFGTKKFDWIIANPEAVKKFKRYIDVDLNRCAPGSADSIKYEEKLAFELVELVKNYKFCVDIHQTRANDRTVLILPKVTRDVLSLITKIGVKNILLWPTPIDATGKSVIYYANCGFGFEVGTKTQLNRKVVSSVNLISDFLLLINSNRKSINFSKKQKMYLVGEKIESSDLRKDIELKDFIYYKGNNDDFVPLLFGRHQNNIGYKMKQIDNLASTYYKIC